MASSALNLRKLKRSSIQSDACSNLNCHRKGRYAVALAGHPCISNAPMTRGNQEVLCEPCAAEAKRIWADLLGETEAKAKKAAAA